MLAHSSMDRRKKVEYLDGVEQKQLREKQEKSVSSCLFSLLCSVLSLGQSIGTFVTIAITLDDIFSSH
jgi:hypothetical protein